MGELEDAQTTRDLGKRAKGNIEGAIRPTVSPATVLDVLARGSNVVLVAAHRMFVTKEKKVPQSTKCGSITPSPPAAATL